MTKIWKNCIIPQILILCIYYKQNYRGIGPGSLKYNAGIPEYILEESVGENKLACL